MTSHRCSSIFLAVLAATLTLGLALSGQAQTETELYTFTGASGGEYPSYGVIFDSAGNLYGTTNNGGNSSNCEYGCGTVFKLSNTASGHWKKTMLHSFSAGNDGRQPEGLVLDAAGNLYGITDFGGASTACNRDGPGCGIVFKLTPTSSGPWKETILYNFAGGKTGMFPSGILTFDSSGNLYGAATFGGKPGGCPNLEQDAIGCGLVFKLTPTSHGPWKETVLYTFFGYADGAYPYGGVIFDAAGNLYGTGTFGGVGCAPLGCGVVFELSPTSTGPWKETTLYTFTGATDGNYPYGPPVFDTAGNLYASNIAGGATGSGTIFEVSPSSSGSWSETTIFNPDSTTGSYTMRPLLFDTAGNLYGENLDGGSANCGTIFELSPAAGTWTENTLLTFDCLAGGGSPSGGLIFDAEGNLYGTAGSGGVEATNAGVVFKITP